MGSERYEELKKEIEDLENWELGTQEYDELLDDIYEEVRIGVGIFSASQILKNCDPVMYDIGYGEEQDYQLDNKKQEISDALEGALNCENITKDEYEELNEMIDNI